LLSHEQLAHYRLLVAGDVMLDRYWFGEVDRISPEAPVPVVRVRTSEERLGGAANVARNMSTLGAHVALLGVVGQDEAGLALDRLLKEAAITAHLHVDTSLSTTVKVRVIGRQQQIVRADFESPPEGDVLLANLDAFTALLPEYGLVVLSDYGKGGLTHIARMIELARTAGRAYCGSTGACRSQGRRVLALRRRHHYHPQSRRAA